LREFRERRVQEVGLDFAGFQCCGDENLYPFRCSACGRLMVFCYECDTLYPDLHTLEPDREQQVNSFDPSRPIFSCSQCGHSFEYYFMRNPAYHVTVEQWRAGGFGHLLRESR
jgi:hypothetical protein